MPKISQRKKILLGIDGLLVLRYIHSNPADENGHRHAIKLLYLREWVSSTRYLVSPIRRSRASELFDRVLHMQEDEFKQTARMSKTTFDQLVELLEVHPVFHNNSRNPQRPAWQQVLVALERFGSYGNGVSVGKIARNFGIGHGTVSRYTSRVIESILAIKKRFIKWPNADQRKCMSRSFEEGFGIPGIVGVLDGTAIVLAQRPAIQGEAYRDRKQRYSINLQLLCNLKKKMIYLQVGWPGSTHDQTAFSETCLSLEPHRAFSRGEFLLADSGYRLTPRTLTPYRQPDAGRSENMKFNEVISQARVCIEHVNGILKNRFSSLCGIRRQIKSKEDLSYIDDYIEACCVLHNFTRKKMDEWPEDVDFDPVADEVTDLEDMNTGEDLRESIKALLIL